MFWKKNNSLTVRYGVITFLSPKSLKSLTAMTFFIERFQGINTNKTAYNNQNLTKNYLLT